MKREPLLRVGAIALVVSCGGGSHVASDAPVSASGDGDGGGVALAGGAVPGGSSGGIDASATPDDASDFAGGGDASTRDDAGAPAPSQASCAPVRHYVFKQEVAVPLGCDAKVPAQIIDQPIPDTGKAVGRATFTVSHGGGNAITHFWNLRVQIGKPVYDYGLGDDVCPGTDSARMNLGFGDVTAKTNRAKLIGHSGAEECIAGTLTVTGATLEVWVEDDQPACVGKDIAFASYYGARGTATFYDWATTFTPLPGVSAELTTTGEKEKLQVLGVVEGSPAKDPNTSCNLELSTIDMQTQLDKKEMAVTKEPVPASGGQGHRVLFTSGSGQEVRYVAPGKHTASLLVASDFAIPNEPVTTGGCCGDGEVALLRLR